MFDVSFWKWVHSVRSPSVDAEEEERFWHYEHAPVYSYDGVNYLYKLGEPKVPGVWPVVKSDYGFYCLNDSVENWFETRQAAVEYCQEKNRTEHVKLLERSKRHYKLYEKSYDSYVEECSEKGYTPRDKIPYTEPEEFKD